MRIRKPPKPKYKKPVKPMPRAKFIPYMGSDLKLAARRHRVVFTSGTPRCASHGERIQGAFGEIYEGWETFCMWLSEPSKPEEELELFPLSTDPMPDHRYSDEIEKRIQLALKAGLQQHERPDHAHFFRWPAKDDAKTAFALKLIEALYDPSIPSVPEQILPSDEIPADEIPDCLQSLLRRNSYRGVSYRKKSVGQL